MRVAIGGGYPLSRVVHLRGRVDAGELGKDQRHDRVLREAVKDLPRRVGEQGNPVALGFVQRAAQAARLMDRIGVRKQQMFAGGGLRSGPTGVVLTGQGVGSFEIAERRCGESAQTRMRPCERVRDPASAVRGVVVYHDQLPVGTQGENAFLLRQQAAETLGEIGFLISRRHNHRQLQRRLRDRLCAGCLVSGRRKGDNRPRLPVAEETEHGRVAASRGRRG